MNAKERAWEAFSRYIRARECRLTTGGLELGRCYTCGRVFRFQELDAGHFMDGRQNAYLFDEDGTRGQCQECNRFHGGRKDLFLIHLTQDLGKMGVERLFSLRFQPCKLDFEEVRTEYVRKFAELSRNAIFPPLTAK